MRTDRCFGSSLKCRLHTERLLSRSSLVHAGPRARNIPASAERLALPRCSAVPRRLLPNLPQRQLQRPPALTRLKNVRLARSLARALDQSLTLSHATRISQRTLRLTPTLPIRACILHRASWHSRWVWCVCWLRSSSKPAHRGSRPEFSRRSLRRCAFRVSLGRYDDDNQSRMAHVQHSCSFATTPTHVQ